MRYRRSAMSSKVLGCLFATIWCGLLVAVSGFLTKDWRLRNEVLGHRSIDQRSKPIPCCNSIHKQRAPSAELLSLSTSSSQQTKNDPSKADSSSSRSNSSPAGFSAFEHWFESAAGAYVDRRVQHATFGASGSPLQLRGLSWKEVPQAERIERNKKRMVATIPASVVLTAPFQNNAHWDRDLALQLWHECSSCYADDDDPRSSGPNLTGYCQLLTNIDQHNNDKTSAAATVVPPSTAPHCLRHWSEEQKSVLSENEQGRRLLELTEQQKTAWRKKYDTWLSEASSHSNPPSWAQFQWAMEAIHSRAFCGVQQVVVPRTTNGGQQNDLSGVVLLGPSILAPVLAAAVACGYTLVTQQEPPDLVLALLALIAVGPALWSSSRFTRPESDTKTTAVLLPLIDSANHCDSADSRIDYNPLTQQFELWIGPQCLVREERTGQSISTTTGASDDNGPLQTQLFVNYGVKSDREWLLNYGFLPGVSLEGADTEDDYRRMLAQAFLRRNP